MDPIASTSDVGGYRAVDRTAINTAATHSNVRNNLGYLINPQSQTHRPAGLRNRTLLKTLRYVGTFVFWRVVRAAKYAVIGSIAAAVTGTILGPFISGAAFLIAPTGIVGFAGAGMLWGLLKFSWRRMAKRIRHGDKPPSDARKDERADAAPTDSRRSRRR